MSTREISVTPVPDPTSLTTEALERGLKSEREYVDGERRLLSERLDGIDLATSLRADAVAKDIAHSQELAKKDVDHQAEMSEMRFAERDVRTAEAATAAATAIAAAFSAQKEAAQKEAENTQKSITRQEENTERALSKLGDLFQTTFDNLREGQAEIKLRVNSAEFARLGSSERQADSRQSVNAWVGVGGFILALLAFVVMAYSLSRTPVTETSPSQTPVVTVTVPSNS
jgi:transcription termination factor NusB